MRDTNMAELVTPIDGTHAQFNSHDTWTPPTLDLPLSVAHIP